MPEEFKVLLRLPRRKPNQGDIIEVKTKIEHPSDPGLELNLDAENIYERFTRDEPATYIGLVEVFYGEEKVSIFEMNSGTANEPLLTFKLKADREAPVRVVATNHRKETAEATADLQFG